MELKTYEFPFGLDNDLPIVLDDDGKPQRQRPATDDDLAEDSQETSPSEHIWRLVEDEQDKWPQLDHKTALERVRKQNPHRFTIYATETTGRRRVD